ECGVLEALPLGDAGTPGGEVAHVGGEPLRRDLEREPGAGGGLVEEVDHGPPSQGGQLLHLAPGDVGQLGGGVQDGGGGGRVQVRGGEQVGAHDSSGSFRMSMTASVPSVSASSTRTCSDKAVGKFLPT